MSIWVWKLYNSDLRGSVCLSVYHFNITEFVSHVWKSPYICRLIAFEVAKLSAEMIMRWHSSVVDKQLPHQMSSHAPSS